MLPPRLTSLFRFSARPCAGFTLVVAGLLPGCAPLRPAPETAAPRAAVAAVASSPDSVAARPRPVVDSVRRAAFCGVGGSLPRPQPGGGFPTHHIPARVAVPPPPVTCNGGRRRPRCLVASARPLSPPLAALPAPVGHASARWGAPRSVRRALLLSSALTLATAALGWLLLVGQRRRRRRSAA